MVDLGSRTLAARTGAEVRWEELPRYRGGYQVSIAPLGGGAAIYPDGYPAGNLPNGTSVARFTGKLTCGTSYVTTWTGGVVISQVRFTTGKCPDPLPLYSGDNPTAQRLCYRLPGCPGSLVFLAPLVVAGTLFGFGVRSAPLLLGAGTIVYFSLGVLLMPSVWIYLFTLVGGGACVLLWRVLR